MKATILLTLTLAMFATVYAAEDEAYKAIYRGYKKECAEANKLTVEDATQLGLGHFSAYTDNNDAKCLMKCIGEKTEFFKDGEYHIENLGKVAEAFGKDSSKALAIAESCKDRFKKPFDCDVAWESYLCLNTK